MNILLTNDDGVNAPGIAALKLELARTGFLTIVAPEGERSSISQAITLKHPIYHHVHARDARCRIHAISGTPADCVKFALANILRKKPDIIVSGINNGSNDGCSVFYSGTVGAAREGALTGIPSVAVSLDIRRVKNYALAAMVAKKVVQWVLKCGLPRGTFLNVNVPDVRNPVFKGIRLAAQCRIPIHGRFIRRKDPDGRSYYWLTGRPPATKKDRGTDSFLLRSSYATVVPVKCDTTDHAFLDEHLKKGRSPEC
jgi:5'-nucleotidase